VCCRLEVELEVAAQYGPLWLAAPWRREAASFSGESPQKMRASFLLAAAAFPHGESAVTPTVTDFAGERLKPGASIPWAPPSGSASNATIRVNRGRAFQTMLGFGSALTESSSFNFAKLNATMQSIVLDLLYGPPSVGNSYVVGRLHMNSADFSLCTYNMCNATDDFSLASFDSELVHDSAYVIPFAKAAAARTGGTLKLFFSPWSPPGWMKESGSMINSTLPTGLKADPRVHASWALYFVKFAQALEAKGLRVWGATIQNEPLILMSNPAHQYESCAYADTDERDFLRDHLGPALEKAGLSDLVIMAYDWNKGSTASYVATILADPNAAEYFGGAAVHWYAWRSDLYLDQLGELAKTPGWNASKHVLLATEACFIQQGVAAADDDPNDGTGVLIGPGPAPGNGSVVVRYAVGELYLLDALGDIAFGAQAWIDWNAMLDYTGGPNHINRSDISAPLLVDADTNSVFVQSMYYYIGHLSRFVPPGWLRVDSSSSVGVAATPADYNLVKLHVEQNLPNPPPHPPPTVDLVVAAAFASPDGANGAVVVLNVLQRTFAITVEDATLGEFDYTLPPRSVVTFSF
jgi:glucosylceramidase